MAGLQLPESDRVRSPFTGWTRAHWEACADRLLQGAAAHSSPAGARIRFPGDRGQDATDELEGFARTFMLATLRLAGGTRDVLGLAERLAEALDAGCTPSHPEAWPIIGHHDQVLVEATAVVAGLHWSKPLLWEQLPDQVRQRLVEWLSGSRGSWCADNNHVLLGATVQAFLASVGADHDPAAIEAALDRIDDWYAGDGWYGDGVGRRFDHYNGWTFHLYPFLIEQLLCGGPADAPGTLASFDVYRSRLRMFLDDYQHLFGPDGPVLQGRSLIYRWGVVAPFWMGALQGVSPLSPGRTRRLASGVLAGFADAGVLDTGVLDLGWKRPAPDLLQPYNAPGSPLWASKGFLGLLLPDRHPVWSDTEEALPVELHDQVRPMAAPAWVAVGSHEDGTVRLLNHGSDGHPRKEDPLYRRLAYSNATVPVRIDGLDDNSVAVGPRGASCVHRGHSGGSVRRQGAASRWKLDAQGRDVVVDLVTFVLGDAEVRLARLRGVLDQQVRCTGWAVPAEVPVTTAAGPGWVSATGQRGAAGRAGGDLVSAIGWVPSTGAPQDAASPVVDVEAGPHRHALGDHVGLPWLELDAGTTGELHLAWLVHLGATWDPAVLEELDVAWTADGAVLTVAGVQHSVAWIREESWPADAVNQGIFRCAPTPLGSASNTRSGGGSEEIVERASITS